MSARDRRRLALPVNPAQLRGALGGARRGSSDATSPTLRCKVEVIASSKGHRATAIVPRLPTPRRAPPSFEAIRSPVESKENINSISLLQGGEEDFEERNNTRIRPPKAHRMAAHIKRNVNIPIQEQTSPVSDYFKYKVEDVPSVVLEEEDGEDWVASVGNGPGLHRYPSIFEDYYGESTPAPPDSPLHTIESLSQSQSAHKRPLPQRQTTVEEQGMWGEFWTDSMRRRGTEKRKPSPLKRTDTLEVSALLRQRRQLAKEGKMKNDSIVEEE